MQPVRQEVGTRRLTGLRRHTAAALICMLASGTLCPTASLALTGTVRGEHGDPLEGVAITALQTAPKVGYAPTTSRPGATSW